jgi:mannose-1-phosphate guanylyltransferase
MKPSRRKTAAAAVVVDTAVAAAETDPVRVMPADHAVADR